VLGYFVPDTSWLPSTALTPESVADSGLGVGRRPGCGSAVAEKLMF
jgi:hypothetical protein